MNKSGLDTKGVRKPPHAFLWGTALFATAALFIVPTMVLAAPGPKAPSLTKTPPYPQALKVLYRSTVHSVCKAGSPSTQAGVRLPSGRALVIACVRSSTTIHTGQFANASAGFAFSYPSQLVTNGAHSVTVNWSYGASACGGITTGRISFLVYDAGNATALGGGSQGVQFLCARVYNGMVQLQWNGTLVANHTYRVQTYVEGAARSICFYGRCGSGSLAVTGWLNWIRFT